MFGGSSFGNSGFGSGGGFGQQNQNSTFGQTNNSFGAGFGQQNQQAGFNNNTTGFGSTPAFGQQPTQAAQPAFGSTGTGGGLFGAAANTSTGFGGFGANNNATNNTTTPGFGSTGSTGLFGQKTAFGSSNTSTTGAFGSNSFNSNAGAGTGTASPAYSVTQDKDTSTGVISLLQSITAMPAYRNYSFEELRAQDYEQGRKSAGQTGTTGFGQPNSFASNTTGFGSSGTSFGATPTSNAGGLFGSNNTQPASGFGQATGFGSGGFGSNTNTTNTNTSTGGLFGSSSFGNTNSSNTLFGQNTSNPSGGFGANNNTTSPFGQASTTPAFGSGGGFGNTTPSKPTFGFGSTPATTTTSAPFGSTSTPAFGSGTPATTGGFGFGGNNAATTGFGSGAATSGFGSGGFGAAASAAPAAPSFGFGSNTGSSFGTTPAASTSFSFGNTNNALGANNAAKPSFGFGNSTTTSAPSGGLFGSSTATSTAGSSLFGGNTNTTTPSLFGNTGTTSNTFGSSLGTAGSGLGGSLNKPAGTTGGLFGTSTNTNTGFGSGFGLSNSSSLGASMQNTAGLGSINQAPLQASIDKNPYGNNPLFSTLPPSSTNATSPLHSSISNTDVLASSTVQKKKYSNTPHFKSTPRSSSKIKLRGFPLGSSMTASTYKLNSSSSVHLFESTNDDTVLSPEAFTPKQSVKKLVINHKIGDTLDRGTPIFGGSTPNSQTTTPTTNPRTVKFNPDLNTYFGHDDADSPQENGVRTLSYLMAETSNDNIMNSSPVNTDFGTEYGVTTPPTKLPTSEYWCSPSVGELKKLSKEGLKNIPEFEVGRIGYGKVRFLEPVDISGLDLSLILGEVVIFEKKSCTVYPDETIKPPVGNGLNVPALISLEQCWPIDKSTRKFITDRNSPRLQQHIRKMKSIPETEFVDFNLDDGSWSFIVQHFSRYGLDDDDEEEEETLPSSNNSKPLLAPEVVVEENVRVTNKRLLSDEDMVDAPPVSWLSPESDDSEREELYNSMDESGIEDTFASPSQGIFMEAEESDHADIGMIGSQWGVSSNADLFKSSSSTLNESQQAKPWARQLGLEAHKVHVMQASLFRESVQDTNPPLLKPVSTAASSWSSKPDHEPVTSVRFGQDMEIQDESESLPENIHEARNSHFSSARSIRPAKKHARVTYEKSLSHSKSDCLVDAGLMMGRSFRVGWGPGGVMVSSGRIVTLQNLAKPSSSTESLSQVNIQKVKIFQNEEGEKQKHEITLKNQLDHTEITLDDNGVPMASTSFELNFKSFVEKLDSNPRKPFETHEVLVWKLAQALWDNTFVPPNDVLSGQALERLTAIHNKTSFTNWLKEAVRPEMLAHIQQLEAKGNNAGIIFAYITGNRISKACVECIKNRDFRLSTLISQAGGDAQSRIDIAHQVLKWKEYRFQSNINADYTRLYELLSGNICPQSMDSLDRQDRSVYVHEGLDWKRTLGLFMWYASFLETSMAESVAKYEHAFLEQNCTVPVALPVPWYQKDSSVQTSQFDVLYCLIKVYIDPTYSLEDAILPLSISPSPLDHRLSWHLFIMLERVLGVRLFERYEDSIDSSPGANACISFAFQLERLGLWKWAVFIMLHLRDTDSREVAIRELIFRHISVDAVEQESDSLPEIQFNDDEMFLLNTLKVPSEWVYEAKALHAKSNGMDYEEAVCLLHANKWNQAHQLIVEKLAPDALLRNQICRLKSLLSHIDSEEVADWENGGLVFLEYIEIFENLPKILENSLPENFPDFIQVKNQMTQLLRTLSRMKEKAFTNTQQTVCIAEMASKISRSLSELDLTEHKEQHLLKSLPLPEDQRLHAVLKLSFIQLYSN
ncbi:hypothetical protein K7432_008451 [Basidiobolus ranarum]|uniref:Peptidase S59 domain-containing protein n=1 Tax=Basidiobolus ranarum TaxID=34480 RepID=A0ABR2VZG6_9FUNG